MGLIDSYKKDGFLEWDAKVFREGVLDRQKELLNSDQIEKMLQDLTLSEEIPLINDLTKVRILERYEHANSNPRELESVSFAIELMNVYHALSVCNSRHIETEPLDMMVNLYLAKNESTDASKSWRKFLKKTPIIKQVDSTHQTIIQRPNVDYIADDIVQALLKKQTAR